MMLLFARILQALTESYTEPFKDYDSLALFRNINCKFACAGWRRNEG